MGAPGDDGRPRGRPGLPVVVDEMHLRRLAAGLSIAETARRAGHGEQVIADAEAHRSRPRTTTLRDYAAAVAPSELAVADRIPHALDCRRCAAASLVAFVAGLRARRARPGTLGAVLAERDAPGYRAAERWLAGRYQAELAALAAAAGVVDLAALDGEVEP